MLSLKAPLLAAAATLALTACGQATNTLPPPTNAPDISPTSLAAFAKATTKAGSSRLHLTMRTPTAHGTLYTSASGRFTTSGKPRGAMTLVLRGDGSKAVHMTERVVWPNLYIKSSIFRKLDPAQSRGSRSTSRRSRAARSPRSAPRPTTTRRRRSRS